MSDARSEDGRIVSCELGLDVTTPAEIVLQLEAADDAAWRSSSELVVEVGGRSLELQRIVGRHGGRLGLLRAPPGRLSVRYRAHLRPAGESSPAEHPGAVESSAAQPAGAAGPRPAGSAGGLLDRITYLRPSRYCPSDHLVGFAVAEFGLDPPPRERVQSITRWIHDRVGYVPGASSVHDSAEDTLLTATGTCRDFAHLGAALCRSLGIPARFASAYAPGLAPMDFHAVFEAWIDGRWCVQDATGLAPRQSMVRIATGLDAADTAFASVLSGLASLTTIEVSAIVTGYLPVDDGAIGVELCRVPAGAR